MSPIMWPSHGHATGIMTCWYPHGPRFFLCNHYYALTTPTLGTTGPFTSSPMHALLIKKLLLILVGWIEGAEQCCGLRVHTFNPSIYVFFFLDLFNSITVPISRYNANGRLQPWHFPYLLGACWTFDIGLEHPNFPCWGWQYEVLFTSHVCILVARKNCWKLP